jgi:hypothetical protein
MKPTSFGLSTMLAGLALIAVMPKVAAQRTAFSYQGSLSEGGAPANGSYNFVFSLYNDSTAGSQVGATQTNSAVPVTNGLFATTVDFGDAPWNGQSLWLQILVSTNGAAAFSSLMPRQPVTPSPYAIQSLNATTANSANSVAGENITGTIPNSALPSSPVFSGTIGANSISGPVMFHSTNNSGAAAVYTYDWLWLDSSNRVVSEFAEGGRLDLLNWDNQGSVMALNNQTVPGQVGEILGHYAFRGFDSYSNADTYALIAAFTWDVSATNLTSFVQIGVADGVNAPNGDGQPHTAFSFYPWALALPTNAVLANVSGILTIGNAESGTTNEYQAALHIFDGPVSASDEIATSSGIYASGLIETAAGFASYATNSLTMNPTGLTNSLGNNNIQILGFSGSSVVYSNSVSSTTITLGTVTGQTIILKPGCSLTGTDCSAAGVEGL